MQVYKYVGMRLCKYASMQVSRYGSIQVYLIKSESWSLIWSKSRQYVTFKTKHQIEELLLQKLLSLVFYFRISNKILSLSKLSIKSNNFFLLNLFIWVCYSRMWKLICFLLTKQSFHHFLSIDWKNFLVYNKYIKTSDQW